MIPGVLIIRVEFHDNNGNTREVAVRLEVPHNTAQVVMSEAAQRSVASALERLMKEIDT